MLRCLNRATCLTADCGFHEMVHNGNFNNISKNRLCNIYIYYISWVSGCCFASSRWTCLLLYHDQNKSILVFCTRPLCTISWKPQSAVRHVALFRHLSMTPTWHVNRKFHKFHIFVTISFKIKFEPNKFRLFITQALYSCVYRYCLNPRFQSYIYLKIERPFPIMAIHISDNKT
jgi:hypothetical protein